jgi:N,N'-diacetylchitobiose transport system permease protein
MTLTDAETHPPATAKTGPRWRRQTESAPVGRSRIGTAVFNTIGIAVTIVVGFPVYWMLNTAFKTPNEIQTLDPVFVPSKPSFTNFSQALFANNFLGNLRVSLIVTITAVAFGLVVGFLGALAIARFRFYGRRALVLCILTVQLVPLVALLIPLFLMLNGLHLTNGLVGVTAVYVVLILPYTVWMLRGFIVNVPRELDEAALVDGCNRWQTFYKVILPLMGPGLVAASIYGFIQCWNEFIIINTLNGPENWNLMAWLASNQTRRGTAFGPLMAGATITSLPVVIFFLIIQKNVAAGLTAGAVKG